MFTTTTVALTQQFLQERREKHAVPDAVFLVDYAKHLAAAIRRLGLRFQIVWQAQLGCCRTSISIDKTMNLFV